jgi:hypothetical protein
MAVGSWLSGSGAPGCWVACVSSDKRSLLIGHPRLTQGRFSRAPTPAPANCPPLFRARSKNPAAADARLRRQTRKTGRKGIQSGLLNNAMDCVTRLH